MSESIKCALLPIAKEHALLMPNSLLAEIVEETADLLVMGAREGIIGKIQWRGHSVPLAAFESIIDFAIPYHGVNAKVAVIFNPQGGSELPFLALSIQGAPKLGNYSMSDLVNLDTPGGIQKDLIASMVEIDRTPTFIPDFSALMSFVKLRVN